LEGPEFVCGSVVGRVGGTEEVGVVGGAICAKGRDWGVINRGAGGGMELYWGRGYRKAG
jgi:hypothetical protein